MPCSVGFIGSHVVRALLEDGHRVRALHLPTDDLRNLRGLEVERFDGDVTDPGAVARAVAGCDWVFHLDANGRNSVCYPWCRLAMRRMLQRFDRESYDERCG